MSNPSENLALKFRNEKTRISQTVRKLKKNPPRDLDYQFQELHEEVFSKIDCLQCANCCKTTSPILLEKDIEKLSQHLKIKPGEFIARYLFLDTDNLYAFKSAPCPFLGSDNYCTVYDYRPKACREYPHTNHRKMHTLLNLAEKNAEICPAVFEILLKIGS